MCPATDVTKKLYIPTKHRSYWCLEFSPPTHHKYVKDPRESTYSSHTEKEPTKMEIALEMKLTLRPQTIDGTSALAIQDQRPSSTY